MNLHRLQIAAAAVRRLGMVFVLLLGAGLKAQTNDPGRWLLVFDGSQAMGNRLSGTVEAMAKLLKSGANGELRNGDSMAVWTYGQQVQGSQNAFEWQASRSVEIATNLAAFLKRQAYKSPSSLKVLNVSLSHLVDTSERLTTVIFCDGRSQFDFTPYDEGINQNFKDALNERITSRQPFVVVLRSQRGKYVGCTVNFPPADISLPPFPPLPTPPPVVVPEPAKPATVTTPVAPALVIVGTKVGTNAEAEIKEVKNIPATNPLPIQSANTNPPVVTATVSNPPSLPPTSPPPAKAVPPVIPDLIITNAPKPAIVTAPTNPPVKTVVVTQVVVKTIEPIKPPAPTNPAPVAKEVEKARPNKFWLGLGIVAALLVTGIVANFVIRARKSSQSSLISKSMEDDSRRK